MQEFPTIPYSYSRKNQEPLFTPPMVENTKTNFHTFSSFSFFNCLSYFNIKSSQGLPFSLSRHICHILHQVLHLAIILAVRIVEWLHTTISVFGDMYFFITTPPLVSLIVPKLLVILFDKILMQHS